MQCQLISKFFDVVDALTNDKKSPRDYGTGNILYHSELNLLDMVHRHPHLNAIELAEVMDITRGAITQIINKLEKKGFIERYFKEENKKAKYFKLTKIGKDIRIGHEKYHACANNRMCEYLRSLNEEDADIIMGFLDKMVDLMPISEFECQYHFAHQFK